jgi:hypothetical protein
MSAGSRRLTQRIGWQDTRGLGGYSEIPCELHAPNLDHEWLTTQQTGLRGLE